MPGNHHQEYTQIEQAFTQLKRRMDSEWSKGNFLGLNVMQARIVVLLNQYGPQKASAIAEQLYITPGAVTGIADKLLEMKLIDRDRAEDDRRVVMLTITESGRELAQKIKTKRAALSSMMFSGLEPEEIQELTRLIEKMIVNVDIAKGQGSDAE